MYRVVEDQRNYMCLATTDQTVIKLHQTCVIPSYQYVQQFAYCSVISLYYLQRIHRPNNSASGSGTAVSTHFTVCGPDQTFHTHRFFRFFLLIRAVRSGQEQTLYVVDVTGIIRPRSQQAREYCFSLKTRGSFHGFLFCVCLCVSVSGSLYPWVDCPPK